MSYQVLARKWRPRDFKGMVGQEHILRMLTNALAQQRLHHAYLFTGTRGVGKTTLARILAKCLNCEKGITPTPCEQCATCQAIDQGKFLDLYEIDAASRTKVEDTRDLLDNVPYPPTQGRYKIYLIDEVHMLSNHSFNALLKTLEEPPEYVKFLLATTDVKRLPITILSRCLQFHLKRISPQQITQHLAHICTSENITFELPALEKLAHAADGSMRDALSLLDQAIAYGQGSVNKEDVAVMLGSMNQDDLFPLLHALAAKDGKVLLEQTQVFAERAPDFHQALEEMLSIFHQIALIQVIPNVKEATSESISTLAKIFSPEDVQLYYQIALLGRRDLALAPSPQQGFEMSLLRMLAFHFPTKAQKLPTSSKPTSNLTPLGAPPKTAHVASPSASANLKSDQQHNNPKVQPVFDTFNEQMDQVEKTEKTTQNIQEWREILPKLELSGMAYALASNCTLGKINADKVELILSASHRPMLNPKLKERIKDALGRYLKKTINLDIHLTTNELATPHKQIENEQKAQLAQATDMMMADPQVKKIIELYDATVEVTLGNK